MVLGENSSKESFNSLLHELTLQFYDQLLRADLEDMIQPPHPPSRISIIISP